MWTRIGFLLILAALSSCDSDFLKRSRIVAHQNTLPRGWKVSFEINPFGTVNGWSNVLHATIGGNNERYGDRTPAIWFHAGSTRLHICSAINGYKSYCYNTHPLPFHRFTKVIVQQSQKSQNFQYENKMFINGKIVHSVINQNPEIFHDVKFYASNPWTTASKAVIKDFRLATFNHQGADILRKSRTIEYKKVLPRGWGIAIRINPFGTVRGWSNVLHATQGGNNGRYGDRIPSIWFNSHSTRLHICSAVNGNKNYCYNSHSLPLNRFSLVIVQQRQAVNGHYYYRIYINLRTPVVDLINKHPQIFYNVKYYASNPWNQKARAAIKDFSLRTYNHQGLDYLQKARVIAHKNILPRGWSIRFLISPFGTVNGWSNVLHATVGGNNGNYGDRIPAIWFHSRSTRLHICSAVNGNKNYCYNSHPLSKTYFSIVTVQQRQTSTGEYFYQIFIGRGRYVNVLNKQPQIFHNVRYYASNPWDPKAKANFKNFQLTTFDHQGSDVLIKSTVVKEIKSLPRGWKVSFEINPFGTVNGWSNVLHATIGGNGKYGSNGKYGDRIPGIWFRSGSTRLHICSAVGGDRNYCYNSRPLPLNRFTRVIVQQRQLKKRQYYYQIYIGGKIVHHVLNTRPQFFNNVKYYGSNPWDNVARARIRNLSIISFRRQE